MMTLPRRLFSCVILVGCLVVAGALCAGARAAHAAPVPRTDKAASGMSLPLVDLSGYKAMVASNHGKALMVTFWATWCEPCRDEFPMIAAFAKKYAPQGLAVVGVSLDEDSDSASARQFVEQAHSDFPNYRVKQGIDVNAFYQGVNPDWRGTMPHTVFYGRDGHIARYLIGARPPAAFEDAIRLILLNSSGDNSKPKLRNTGE
ncbi:MAG: TlpA family protein disulfide reductase [Candidatus Acidiferrales bacterium]